MVAVPTNFKLVLSFNSSALTCVTERTSSISASFKSAAAMLRPDKVVTAPKPAKNSFNSGIFSSATIFISINFDRLNVSYKIDDTANPNQTPRFMNELTQLQHSPQANKEPFTK